VVKEPSLQLCPEFAVQSPVTLIGSRREQLEVN
jgi:hypothetical protein